MSDANRPGQGNPPTFYVPAPGEPGGSPAPTDDEVAADLAGSRSTAVPDSVPSWSAPAQAEPAAPVAPTARSWQDIPAPAIPPMRPTASTTAPPVGGIFVPSPGDAAGPAGSRPPAPAERSDKPSKRTAQPSTKRRRRLHRPRFKLRYLFLLIPLVPLLIVGGVGLYVWSMFGDIERVQVSSILSPASGAGTNYLLVGSDARPGVAGNRSDTIIVLRVESDGAKMMSIPRDLYVTIAETGDEQKINAAYNGGPARLIKTVQTELDIPIHRYIEVTFQTFGPIVDALGGIEINFEHQAFDTNTGFQVPSPGTHRLDGFNALAFVRSRHYVEVIDGQEVEDPTADLGRQERQQAFLSRTFTKIGEIKNPAKLLEITKSMTTGLVLDDAMGPIDAFKLAQKMRGGAPESVVLPTHPDRVGSASVLIRNGPEEVEPVLDRFR